jgi:hypothetical protein
MNSLSIYYSTPFDVPAPFCYEVSFEFSSDNQLHFEMIYTNREDLTDDEIINEGFTENDDFKWNGNLNSIWKQQIDELMAKTDKRASLVDQEIILKTGDEEFAPKNYKEWSFLIQDLIQAVFETSGKEQPWQLELVIIKKDQKKLQQMKVLFAIREVDFAFGSNIKMDWARSKKFMELIYLGEFDETKASIQKSDREGVYLCFDQQTWYKLGHSITNPHGNKSYLGKLGFELEGLV